MVKLTPEDMDLVDQVFFRADQWARGRTKNRRWHRVKDHYPWVTSPYYTALCGASLSGPDLWRGDVPPFEGSLCVKCVGMDHNLD